MRLINGLLIFSCLLLASCNFPDNAGQAKRTTSNANAQPKRNISSQTSTPTPPIEWLVAKKSTASARAKFDAKNKDTATVRQVVDDANQALGKLPKDEAEIDVTCGSCGADALSKTKHARTSLAEATKTLNEQDAKKLSELSSSVTNRIISNLETASSDLQEASDAYSLARLNSGDNSNSNDNNSANQNDTREAASSWTDLIWPIAGGVAGLGLIVLAVFGMLRWRSGFWMKFDGHVNDIVAAHVGGVKKRHDEMAKHSTTVGEEQRKTSGRLESIEGEIQALGRRLRQGALDGSGYQGSSVRQAFDEYAKQPVQPVEPEFPASADEYLNKMKRNSLVVKPDFQNGILVNDIDGKGELVLIRDSSIPDELQPLFVVPRVTQFQTKQEFHAYYERYYDCQRPSAGDVWIIDPAIVSTVPGGWQLREKGVLEVR